MEVVTTLKYIARRLLLMIPTVLVIILIIMVIISSVPGGSLRALSSHSSDGPDLLDKIMDRLGLHDTFFGKYIRYVANICHGDFGDVRAAGKIMKKDLPFRTKNTLKIAACGITASVVFGIPMGFTAALYRGKAADNGITTMTLILSAIPSYCIAVFCSLTFVLWLKWLPLTGYGTPKHYIMPTIVTALPGFAIITAITRSAVLNVLGQQFVTTLRAGGISTSRIIYVHVLRNALVIFVSSLQNVAISILCSSLIAENFYSIPGLGQLIISAVSSRNILVCLGGIIIISIMLMLVSLICDILCMLVDPRMHLQMAGGKK